MSLAPPEPRSQPLSRLGRLLCAWPIGLLPIFLGAGLYEAILFVVAVAAYFLNVSICKSNLPIGVKSVVVLMTGCAAIGIWIAVAMYFV